MEDLESRFFHSLQWKPGAKLSRRVAHLGISLAFKKVVSVAPYCCFSAWSLTDGFEKVL